MVEKRKIILKIVLFLVFALAGFYSINTLLGNKVLKVNILRWRSHPISWNRATGSVIESQSSDGGSHDLCRGSQLDDLVFDHPFPLPHGNIPVNPHGIGRWDDTVKDGIGKGTAS